MNPRKTARIVGVLFIVAIVAGIILDDPDYLNNVPANENQVLTGTPFEFTLAIAVAVMPFLIYPILKKHNVSLALGFVGGPLAVRNWGYGMIAPIVFSLGSLMFYYILYKSKLVPRWLSGWSLIGAVLFLTSAFLTMFGYGSESTIYLLFNAPGGLGEMVFAVWLIVKGFNPSAIDSPAANTE